MKQSHWPAITFPRAAVATDLLIKTVDSSFCCVVIEYCEVLAGLIFCVYFRLTMHS